MSKIHVNVDTTPKGDKPDLTTSAPPAWEGVGTVDAAKQVAEQGKLQDK